MAGSKTVKGTFGGYTHSLKVEIVSQDQAANTSRLKYTYKVKRETAAVYGAWTTLNNVTFHAVINGTDHTASPNFDFRSTQTITMMTGYQTVTHGTDGNLTINVRFHSNQLPGSVQFVATDKTQSFTLDRIMRATPITVRPNPVIEGGTVTISLPRANSAFTHTVTYETEHGDTGTIGTGIATSTTWTPDEELLDGGDEVMIHLVATTYNGANVIGTSSTDLRMRTPPDYPAVGVGTPYDLRFRRTAWSGSAWNVLEQIPYIEATFTDTFSATATCKITVPSTVYATSLDNAVIELSVYDGSQWINPELRFVLTRVEHNDTDITDVITYEGVSYVDHILGKGLVPGETPTKKDKSGDREFKDVSPGNIMAYYINDGKTRGWGPRMAIDFSSSKTSAGTSWSNTDVTMKVSQDTPFLQLLEGFVKDVLVEYRTGYKNNAAYLRLFNPGYGSDWTIDGADPVVNLALAAVNKVAEQAPVKKDYSGQLTRVTVRGKEVKRTREKATAVNALFGHLEGAVEAVDVKDKGRLDKLGDAALNNQGRATVERTFQYDLSSNQTPHSLYPYRTFRPGDWVMAPGDDGPERVRVSQVAITRNSSGTKATITVGDLIPSGIAAQARRLTQATGGSIAGGSLRSPSELADAIPAAPQNITYTVDGYWDENGFARAGIAFEWDEVTESLEGSDVDVDLYEIVSRQEIGSPWVSAGVTDSPEILLTGLMINTTRDYMIRARSEEGVYGEWSDILTVSTVEPDEVLPAPTAPTLEANAVGTVAVTWDGLLEGNPPPLWFSYVRAEISDAEDGAFTVAGSQLTTGGTITVPGVGDGTWWFRLVPVDTLGVDGDPSDAVSVEVQSVLADTRKPKAPTGLVVSSFGYWTGPTPEAGIHAEWDAVTEAEDDSEIDVVLYEVWGRRDEDAIPRLITASTSLSADYAPIGPIGSTWQISVRAMGANNEWSDLSDEEEVVIAEPDVQLDRPSAPELNTWRGLLLVSWDGNLLGLDEDDEEFAYPAPSFLTRVDVWVATMEDTDNDDEPDTFGDPVRMATMTRGDRSISIPMGVGDIVQVTLVAVDRLDRETDPSDAADIQIVGIDGADLLANSVSANHISAGSINVNHLAPGFGDEINIAGNVTITSAREDLDALADDLDDTNTLLDETRTVFQVTPSGARISSPDSVFDVNISNVQMEFREGGIVRAFLNAGVFNAPRMASNQIVLRYHVIEDDSAGTVIRRLS